MVTAATTVDVPPHVTPDRVVDFDFYKDPRFATDDIHTAFAKMLKQVPPVFWTPHNGGHWVIAGHEELFEASRNTEMFSSTRGGLPPSPYEPSQLPISIDPPRHAIYREPLARAFSPKAMMALEGDIRTLAIELIEKVRKDGKCDFAAAVAEPLPVTIFMKLMGMPLDRLGEFRQWVNDLLASGDPQIKADTMRKIMAFNEVMVRARMARREDDLVSRLLDTQIEGRPITLEEMLSYCLLLFTAGLDTVMNGMCYGIRHMAEHPELQAELRVHPERITDAMEEALRRYTFTQPGRIVAHDGEAFGVRFRKGDMILLALAGSGLDEREFDHALDFDIAREHKAHIAFNSGPHRCVGSHLARIEMRICYEEMLKRLPEFRLDPANPPRMHGGQVIGYDSLPLLWDPA